MGDSQNISIRASETNARIVASQKKKKDGEARRAIAAAKKSDSDAKRAAAAGKKSAGGKGVRGGKSGRFRSTLRAAARRGGRGISVQSLINGRGFAGVVSYAIDPDKNARVVDTNSSGSIPALTMMIRTASLRPDIKEPVGHISFSLPPGETPTAARWKEIATELRAQLGIDDSHPYLVVEHRDTAHPHAHLIFSRVSVDGKVHDQRNIGLRCGAAEAAIEQKFNLRIVPREKFKFNSNISKNEVEMGLRTAALPPRLQIAEALKIATQGKPTTEQFVERLQSAGVGVRANISPGTGKMNGFSFTFGGVAFSGSKISKEFGWQQLQERIQYEARDTQYLVQLDGRTGRADRDLAAAAAAVGALDRAVAEAHPAAVEPAGPAIGDPAALGRAILSPDQRDRQATQNAAVKDAGADRAAGRDDLDSAAVPIYSKRHERDDVALPDLSSNRAPLTTTTGDQQHGQTRLFGFDNEDPGRASGGDTAASTAAPAFTYISLPRPAAARVRGVRNLSEFFVASDAHRDQVLLRPDAQHSLGHQPAAPDHRVRRTADPAPVARKSAAPAAPSRPAGFAAIKPLAVNLQDWAARLPNRISVARQSSRLILAGLMDDRSRTLAVSTNHGYSVPDPRLLSDDQLVALLNDPDIEQPVRIDGTPDFCSRIEQIAHQRGLTVLHDHQLILAAELRQAEQRDRDRDDERSSYLPVYVPK